MSGQVWWVAGGRAGPGARLGRRLGWPGQQGHLDNLIQIARGGAGGGLHGEPGGDGDEELGHDPGVCGGRELALALALLETLLQQQGGLPLQGGKLIAELLGVGAPGERTLHEETDLRFIACVRQAPGQTQAGLHRLPGGW